MIRQLIRDQGTQAVQVANILAVLAHFQEWGQEFQRMYEIHMGAALGGARMQRQKAQ